MRRTLLLLILVPLLAAGIFLGAFAVSELNVRGQSFFTSLSDFVFLNDGAFREALDRGVPPLTEARYRSVIGRFRQRTHNFVEHQAVWWLSAWGEAAVPYLVEELRTRQDYPRTCGAIRALGEIGGAEAAAALAGVLAELDPAARYQQVYHLYIVEALGKIPLRTASLALIAAYERNPAGTQTLAELGRTGTPEAAAYLLNLAADVLPPDRSQDDLIWGLVMSRSPLAARMLVDWMISAEFDTARLCRDALDQFAREEAVEPLLDALQKADNDPLRATILDLLDGQWIASSPRLVTLIEPYLDDPWLGDAARDTLSRAGSREAWLAVQRHLPAGEGKAWLADDRLFHVFYRFGAVALPELFAQLRTAPPREQADALRMLPRLFLPEARAYLEPLRSDPDPQVARAVRTALLRQDKVDLFRSFTLALPERFGQATWENFRPDWFFMDFNYEAGFEAVWNVFAWLHLGGLALALLLGWTLLVNALRVFESYRFSLFLLFLLAEGFIGDFLFCDHWPLDPGLGYRLATAVHLLLLIGFLARERERVPGELRGRFERLGGASLWLLLPLLLLLGTPAYAESLRTAMSQWQHFSSFALLLAALTALVIEQALIPRHRMPRRFGVERLLGAGLTLWLLVLFGGAVGRLTLARLADGDHNGAVVTLLLILPLPWFLALHLATLRPREWWQAPPQLAVLPGTRLRVAGAGAEITLHLVPPRSVAQRLVTGTLKVAFVLAAAATVAFLAGRDVGLDAMVLAVFAGLIGAALAGMLLQGGAPRLVIQIRDGFLRFGRPRWGGVVGGAPWRRRPTVPRVDQELKEDESPIRADGLHFLTRDERAWLCDVQQRSAAAVLWICLLTGLLYGLFLAAPSLALAVTPPEIRLLKSDDPADWQKAVELIVPTDQYAVPGLLIGAVTERLPELRPESQLRLMRKMTYALERDPRLVAVYRQLAAVGAPEVRTEAQRALAWLERGAGHYPSSPQESMPLPWLMPLLRGAALLVVLAPLALGVALLLWGLRLLQLHRLLRHLPLTKTRTVTPGLVALRGAVHAVAEPLYHPETGEQCVYYVGAERRHPGLRFWLEDDSGRVQVDPAGMVMLSEDGVLQPGERVQLLATAVRGGAGRGAERWVLGKDRSPRNAFERLVHGTVERLFGFFSGSDVTRMLFSDPQRCFWIWDDLQGRPFGSRGELATIVAVFAFAGGWLTVAAIVATALLDRDLGLLTAWLY